MAETHEQLPLVHPLVEKYGRAQLGIDGNCGFALLGPNPREGEAEFVEIEGNPLSLEGQLRASKRALMKLRERLGAHIPYYFGRSHPYGD